MIGAGTEKSPRWVHGSGGFTLIELLIVLVIAAMVLAVAPPLIARALPGVEIKGAARQLTAVLKFARNHAISSQKQATVAIDVEQRTFRVTGKQRQFTIKETITIDLVTAESEVSAAGVGSIRFYPSGGSTGGRVTLSDGKRSFDIDIDWLTGRVRILD